MLNLRRIDLNLLTVFEAIFSERNLTRAANRIGMSQPAMSNALNRLRFVFDDDLFVRQGNSMQPTPRAQQISRQVDKALAAVRECIGEVSDFNPRNGRTFNIAGIESVDLFILPRLLRALDEYKCGIHINTYSGFGAENISKLKSGDIDLLIESTPFKDEELRIQHLMTDHLVCIVRADHPAVGKQLSDEDFDQLFHAVLQAPDEHGYHMEQLLLDRGLSDRIAARTAHLFGLPLIAEQSNLVCSVPQILANFYCQKHNLVKLDLPVELPRFPIVAMWHQNQDSDPGHRWLRDKLFECCKDL